MRAFISVDMEGMPHIVIPGHLTLKGTLYEEARKIATNVTLVAADELHKNGFAEILIADSHGPMVNLLVDDLPEYVEVIRGYPRPLSMIAGIESCDIAMFLGYHAKFGTARSTFDHTYSGASIISVNVNDIPASEFLLNSYAAGEFKVPVALVAGDAQLLNDDVTQYAPWAETVVVKRSLGRLSARSPSMKVIESDLRKKVRKATTLHRQGKTRLLKARKPVKMRLTFSASHFADAAAFLPTVERIDGLTIEYSANCMVDAYKTFELLALAASGVSAVIESSK